MNRNVTIFILGIAVSAYGQSFQDLSFEAATVSPSPPAFYPNPVPIASALPGWSAYLGNTLQQEVQYNTTTLGDASISLLGPTWSARFPGIIDGNYSVILQSGVDPSETFTENATLAQNGTIPATDKTLEFSAYVQGILSVSFAGNPLPLVVLSSAYAPSGQPYNIYGVDISAFAGETGQLQFTENFNVHYPFAILDDISFSQTSIAPEPTPVALAALGGLMLVVQQHFRKR